MFKIFAESHKIIGNEIYKDVLENYDFKLDKDSLLWGSISPDILPKYKFIRHYKDESLDFVVGEIIDIIYSNRDLDLGREMDPLKLKVFSRRLGIVSHYLTDYNTLPHAKRWTFQDSMLKHIKYEAKLNEVILNHEFDSGKVNLELDFNSMNKEDLRNEIRDYINHIVEEEYTKEVSFENDLDFALSINIRIFHFVLDTIEAYSEAYEGIFALQI